MDVFDGKNNIQTNAILLRNPPVRRQSVGWFSKNSVFEFRTTGEKLSQRNGIWGLFLESSENCLGLKSLS